MKFAKIIWLSFFLSAIILSACNAGATPAPTQDVGAIQTQALQTVVAQFGQQQTQTAAAIPPTSAPTLAPLATATLGAIPTVSSAGATSTAITQGVGTPFAFNTPSAGFTPLASVAPTQAGQACTDSTFVEDVTVPDGTQIKAGGQFVKIWKVQNTGTCMWDDGFVLKYLGGYLDGRDITFKHSSEFVKPGQMREFRQELTAPETPNTYEECWRLRDDGGFYFGTYLCVKVVVVK
jgi:hypothetical protein